MAFLADDPSAFNTTVLLDGHKVDITWRSGVLQWRGSASAGRLSFEQQVYGCRVGPASITIFTFEVAPKGCVGGMFKKRTRVVLEFPDEAVHSQWASLIQDWFQSIGRPKKLLVLVNPKGGQGQASKRYSDTVEPMLVAAGIQVTKKETLYFRHALEIAKEADISSYDGIVCVSGDGVLVEVLNGLLERGDWQEAVKMPLGIIPAGSGNGAAKSIAAINGEECDVISATFKVIKGQTRKVDVSTVRQGSRIFHSILNITWGLVSDVDVESEKYRWMGGFRLTFQSVIRILGLRRYRGRISYLPADAASPANEEAPAGGIGFQGAPVQPVGGRQLWKEVGGEFVLLWLQNLPWAATDMHSHPLAQFSDGCLDMVLVKDTTKLQLLSLLLQMENGSHMKSSQVEYVKVKAVRIEPGPRVRSEVGGGYINVDGEVLARGEGTMGTSREDLMVYNEPFEVTIEGGLATFFAPSA